MRPGASLLGAQFTYSLSQKLLSQSQATGSWNPSWNVSQVLDRKVLSPDEALATSEVQTRSQALCCFPVSLVFLTSFCPFQGRICLQVWLCSFLVPPHTEDASCAPSLWVCLALSQAFCSELQHRVLSTGSVAALEKWFLALRGKVASM